MARLRWAFGLWVLTAWLSGCADNSMVLKGRVTQYEQQQANLVRQNQILQDRARNADRDNQELVATVAKANQRTKIAEEQLTGLREQLKGTTDRLAQLQSEKDNTEQKANSLMASMHRQGGVVFEPNNSYLQTLPVIRMPDVHVRRDGDVIRVELPGQRLFDHGSAQLRPEAVNVVAEVANEIHRKYPDQIVGIEGHTDNDPIRGGQWRNNHQLSLARAMAVYDVMTSNLRYPSEQLFVVGHGANHPVVSNATIEGKQRNRRVELVIYSDRKGS